MDLKDIYKLIDKLNEKGINEFELEREGFKIRIRKDAAVFVSSLAQRPGNPEPVVESPPEIKGAVEAPVDSEKPVEPETPKADNLHVITSPIVGTFYSAPSPGAKPYVEVGDRVRKGQVCCIVEAMKLMNEILIDVNGVVKDIHVDNNQPVEYGEPLITIEISR